MTEILKDGADNSLLDKWEKRWLPIMKIIRATNEGLTRGVHGRKVHLTDLWSFLSPHLMAEDETWNHVDDATLWSLQKFLNSDSPVTALYFLGAVHAAAKGEDPKELFEGIRRARIDDVRGFVPNCSPEEWDIFTNLMARGAVEGYEILSSEAVDEPVFFDTPLKFLPIPVSASWLSTSKAELPLDLNMARFIVADETIAEIEQITNLIPLSMSGSPLIVLCHDIYPEVAEELGRGWRDGWARIIPCSVSASGQDEYFKLNLLSDTVWITGSNMCTYITRNMVSQVREGSPEISKDYLRVSLLNSGIRFPAIGSRSFSKARVQELLDRANGEDEESRLLHRRAAYISGGNVQLILPDFSLKVDPPIAPQVLDLLVSAYKGFMEGAAVWYGLFSGARTGTDFDTSFSGGSEEVVMPVRHAYAAMEHALAISTHFTNVLHSVELSVR